MVFKKFTRSTRKPKRTFRKKMGTKNVASKYLPTLKKQLHIPKPEVKVSDVISPTTNISTSLTGIDFAYPVSQGLTDQLRVGRCIQMKYYQVNMTLTPDPSNVDGGLIRLIFIHQFAPNNTSGSINALMTAAQVLQTNSIIRSPYQFDQNGYKVIYDKVFEFPGSYFAKPKHLKINLPVSGLEVEWTENDTIGNSANLKKGYVRGFIMHEGFGATVPIFDCWQRVAFTDS